MVDLLYQRLRPAEAEAAPDRMQRAAQEADRKDHHREIKFDCYSRTIMAPTVVEIPA